LNEEIAVKSGIDRRIKQDRAMSRGSEEEVVEWNPMQIAPQQTLSNLRPVKNRGCRVEPMRFDPIGEYVGGHDAACFGVRFGYRHETLDAVFPHQVVGG
jgi:hypothetical protein